MRFNIRGFISILLTLSFIVISFTGIVLYVSPAGRVANWTTWTVMGLTKTQWGAIHTLSSFLFIVTGIIHLLYNWRTLLAYLKNRATKAFSLKAELVASILIMLVFWAGSAADMPPFGTVMAIGESIRATWEENAVIAPAPHTELKTLADVADDLGMLPDRVLDKLARNGISGAALDKTLADIAAENDIPPSELYGIIQQRGQGSGLNE